MSLIPNLPNDLALQCLARVPRRYHHILSAVSKPFRSAVSSSEFFDLRSRLGVSDDLFFVRVRAPFQVSPMWFALYRTDQGNMLQSPVPPLPVHGINQSAAVAIGSSIYVVGGWTLGSPSSGKLSAAAVFVLDCRSNTWSRGPSMAVARASPMAAVLDGKIYIIGGGGTGSAFAEALDVSSGRWDALPEPPVGRANFRLHAVEADGGVIRVWGLLVELRFDPATWEWLEPIPLRDRFGSTDSWCLFNGAWYAREGSRVTRLDEAGEKFKEVPGVAQGLAPERWLGPKLVNAGGHRLVAMVGRGAGCFLDWHTIPDILAKPEKWASATREPFEAWFAEIKVSEGEENGAVGEIVWSKRVLSEYWPTPPEGIPYPHVYLSDWNLFQVSL